MVLNMTTLVNQRFPTDCMIAAIAMALAVTWEEVYDTAIKCEAYKKDHSSGINAEDDILECFGLVEYSGYQNIDGDFRSIHRPYSISPEYFREQLWGRPVIFSAPSLNKAGGSHAVYYDGHEIFDPNPPSRNRYSSFSELLPTRALVFKPNVTAIVQERRGQ